MDTKASFPHLYRIRQSVFPYAHSSIFSLPVTMASSHMMFLLFCTILSLIQSHEQYDRLQDPQALFEWALTNNEPTTIEEILASSYNIDPRIEHSSNQVFSSNRAIYWATENGYERIVELLLNWKGEQGQRIDPTEIENRAVQMASDYGHSKVVERL